MKYIIELEKIEGTDLYRAKGANTLVFDERGIENILKPLPEPDVDWTKVAVDTPILVSQDNKCWYKRYFAEYENEKIYAWLNGATSFSQEKGTCPWDYAKLAEVKE